MICVTSVLGIEVAAEVLERWRESFSQQFSLSGPIASVPTLLASAVK
jgi:hypothetical protein